MDGFGKDEVPVVIVGATNIAKAVDTALKRPGRFDRKLLFHPNLEDRIKILRFMLRTKNLKKWLI